MLIFVLLGVIAVQFVMNLNIPQEVSVVRDTSVDGQYYDSYYDLSGEEVLHGAVFRQEMILTDADCRGELNAAGESVLFRAQRDIYEHGLLTSQILYHPKSLLPESIIFGIGYSDQGTHKKSDTEFKTKNQYETVRNDVDKKSFICFNEDGTLREWQLYNEDLLICYYSQYYPNGNIKLYIEEDDKHKTTKAWTQTGKLIFEEIEDKGLVQVTRKRWDSHNKLVEHIVIQNGANREGRYFDSNTNTIKEFRGGKQIHSLDFKGEVSEIPSKVGPEVMDPFSQFMLQI